MQGVKTIPLTWIFSKGNYQDRGIFNVPVSYSPDTINTRIVKWSTVLRNGYRRVAVDEDTLTKKVRGIVSLKDMYVARNSKFQKVNLTTWLYEDVATATFSGDYKVNFMTFDKYIIALTGDGFPYVYDIIANTRTQLTSSNIAVDAKPTIGAIYGYGSYVIWWPNGNIVFMSRGATKTNPEYIFDWVWSGAEQLLLKGGKAVGIASTLNRLFIWTEKGIEYISKETMTNVGNTTATLTLPLWWENQPASQWAIVVADEVIFFFTKSIGVKTIGYTQGITDPQIGNISETATNSMRTFFDSLDEDQSDCYGYYNKTQRTVTWYVKKKGSIYNDTCLVYDIVGDNFFVDTNRFGIAGTRHNGKEYVASSINSALYENDIGKDDDDVGIGWYRYTKRIDAGNPNKRKVLREIGISGEIPDGGEIMMDIIVDGKVRYTTSIKWVFSEAIGLWSWPQGSNPVWWEKGSPWSLYPFNKIISRWQLRFKWLRFQFKFYGNTIWEDFVLSDMNIGMKMLDNTDISEKI